VWNDEEHRTGAANIADLMYAPSNAENRQLATVNLTAATQLEIRVRTAEGLV
jgi:hypothetical protein